MTRPDTIIIEGRAYSWRVLLELRREQLEAWKAAQPLQPALFELKADRRPEAERSAAGLSGADAFMLPAGCGRLSRPPPKKRGFRPEPEATI